MVYFYLPERQTVNVENIVLHVHVLTFSPGAPAGPGGPMGPVRPRAPSFPAAPSGPLAPGSP